MCGNCDYKTLRFSLFLTHIESRPQCKKFLDENPPPESFETESPQNAAPIPVAGMIYYKFILGIFLVSEPDTIR